MSEEKLNNGSKMIMITQNDCIHCKNARKLLSDKIDSGLIEELNISVDKRGIEIANKLGISGTPTMIVKDKITNALDTCFISKDGKKLLCSNNKEIDI